MTVSALDLVRVSRRYGSRAVLTEVSLALEAGEVHALVGENGAGKTTLIRAACGIVTPDAGAVRVGERELAPGDPRAAIRAGVGVVHQHFMLIPVMTVADNVALGVEPRTGPLGLWVDRARVRREVAKLAEEHALPVDPDARVESLAVGERQRVEILKVLYRGAKVLLLDEPTAVLSPGEVEGLLDTVRALASRGAAVLFVSHKLDEVFAVADRVTVLRRGAVTLSKPIQETTGAEVARAVVGGDLPQETSAGASNTRGETVALELADVSAPGLDRVSLTLRAGEVVGVAGVEGNGQRALAEVIAGVRPVSAGVLQLAGEAITGASVASRRAAGFGWVPEDREGRGLLSELSVAENVALGDPANASRGGRFDRRAAEAAGRALIERYKVQPPDPWAPVGSLSGGNQQKVLLGRELARELVALVVAQPTRGVDLGASAEIHRAIREAAARGAAVLVISSELDELRRLSHRVVVMRRGAIVGDVPVAEASDASLGALMVGGGDSR